jgi:hypothetical protein
MGPDRASLQWRRTPRKPALQLCAAELC